MLSRFFGAEKKTQDFFVKFKTDLSLSHRQALSKKILTSNEGKAIPMIIDTLPNEKTLILKHNKFIIPRDVNMSFVMIKIREHLSMTPTDTIFLCTKDNYVYNNQSVDEIYEKNKDVDGFLYIRCCYENTFG